jgi:Na+/melibiose symporter-like transporter
MDYVDSPGRPQPTLLSAIVPATASAAPRLLLTQQVAYLGGSFALGVFTAFNNFTLTLWLTGFTSIYLLLALLGNTRSFEGAFVSPLVGRWSDRVWLGWLGRRRPFILIGGLLSALLLALTPAIGQWPLPTGLNGLPGDLLRLAPIVLAILLFTLTFNAMDDVHKALLADLTVPDQRNRLSSFSVVADMGGQMFLLLLGFALWGQRVPDAAFGLTGALVATGVLLTVVGVREPEPTVWRATGDETADHPGANLSPRALLARYPGAAMLCLVVSAYWFGVNAVLPLVSIYCRDILGASEGEAQLLPALLMLSTILLALPMGRLGDRFGKRRIIGLGYAIMACAALAGLVITNKEQGAVVFLLAGVGNAACCVLTIPLLADLVPIRRMGAATGVMAASASIAAPLSSLVAGALCQLFGPRAIFGVMAVAVVAALALLTAVQSGEAGEDDLPALKATWDGPL